MLHKERQSLSNYTFQVKTTTEVCGIPGHTHRAMLNPGKREKEHIKTIERLCGLAGEVARPLNWANIPQIAMCFLKGIIYQNVSHC